MYSGNIGWVLLLIFLILIISIYVYPYTKNDKNDLNAKRTINVTLLYILTICVATFVVIFCMDVALRWGLY